MKSFHSLMLVRFSDFFGGGVLHLSLPLKPPSNKLFRIKKRPRGLAIACDLNRVCFIELLNVYYLFLRKASLSQCCAINRRKACLGLGQDSAPLCSPVFPFKKKSGQYPGALATLNLCAGQDYLRCTSKSLFISTLFLW